MLFAPVLDEVAAWMAGAPSGARGEPDRWAYRLRDAVALVRPDWVVTHHDLLLEAAAIDAATRSGAVGPVEVSLPGCPAVAAQIELTRVLAGLFPGTVVAASLTGPSGVVEALTCSDGVVGGPAGSARVSGGPAGPSEVGRRSAGSAGAGALTGGAAGVDPDLLADCGDALADLAGAYVAAGAARVLVWEPPVADEDAADVVDAHTPILRKLGMLGVPGVLCGGDGLGEAGYAAHAGRADGRGAVLADPGCFAAGGPGSFEDMWADWSARQDGSAPGVVVTAGPLPYACDPALLRAAGRRPR